MGSKLCGPTGYSRAMACFESASEPPQRAVQRGRHPELVPAAWTHTLQCSPHRGAAFLLAGEVPLRMLIWIILQVLFIPCKTVLFTENESGDLELSLKYNTK